MKPPFLPLMSLAKPANVAWFPRVCCIIYGKLFPPTSFEVWWESMAIGLICRHNGKPKFDRPHADAVDDSLSVVCRSSAHEEDKVNFGYQYSELSK